MPIFEYKCLKCGHIQEKYMKNSNTRVVHCPKCENRADRIPSVANFAGERRWREGASPQAKAEAQQKKYQDDGVL